MQLIIAEKPSVARDLARVLGVRPSGQHVFEGERCAITWCIGHLVELDEPASYDPAWKAWRLDTLPMVPSAFRLRPSKHAVPQLRAVAKLLRDRQFTHVVNACDAGREGELIFRYLYQYASSRLPVQRLWISSLTDDAIRRGFATLRPGAQLDPLGDAARSRSEADWLVGMNATRGVTAHNRLAGHSALYSIGRVQTPTLAMLVEREHAIRGFVPRDYWEVRGEFRTASGDSFTAGWRYGTRARLATDEVAAQLVARTTQHGAAADPSGPRVERLHKRTVREPAPMLFDLTSLQRTANRRFGFSAARTLELAQALYERHKVLTYPRTDSRHLTTDVAGELPGLFAALASVPDYAPFAAELIAHPPRPGRRVIDDTKVHDHHAIIPTGKLPAALDRDERRVFDLVVRRFLGVFFPDAEFAVTEAWVRVGPGTAAAPKHAATATGPATEPDDVPLIDSLPPPPDRFLARGRIRIAAGWQVVAGIEDEPRRDREADESRALLPALVEGEALTGMFSSVAKQTRPPPRFSEATLLGAMESAGKVIDDETLRLAMKDCGLGTPATRAAVIETLLSRTYIVRDKQHLVPTELGIGLLAALPVASLASPELTGSWEARLARIARGEESRGRFMADIAQYVAELVDAIRSSTPPPAPAATVFASCRRCGADIVEQPRAFRCPCGIEISKRIAGREITAALAGVLIDRGRTTTLRGFRSKAGKKFAAMLVLDEAGKVRFEFDQPGRETPERKPATPPPRPSKPPREQRATKPVDHELACPRCKAGKLLTGSRGWGCSRWRDGCRFVVWFRTAGKQLTAAQLRDLVTRGKTRKARFQVADAVVTGRLVLDPDATDGSARFEPG
ncbi:MAG: DNA topoisomerase [Kofleriaceae bacterium]